MVQFKNIVLALIVLFLPLSTPVRADKAMLVLDSSGSMNAQINGKTKLQIAREVVNGLVEGWPQATDLGLIAYGHREKDNCGDIQTLVQPASGSWPAIKAAVGDIAAKGKTPITDAIRAAARELHSEEGKATVILVSDGLETCNADPCAAVAELEKAGVDFTVHVVGFGTTAEENRQLQCIADKTGGRFLGAKNASELKTAMTKTVELVAKPEPPKQNVVKVNRRGILKLTNSRHRQDIYDEAGTNRLNHHIPDGAELPPGKYRLQDTETQHMSTDVFEIKSGETLDINQVSGFLTTNKVIHPQMVYDESGTRRLSTHSFSDGIHLPPGRYFLEDDRTKHMSTTSFEIKAGQTLDIGQLSGRLTLKGAKNQQSVYDEAGTNRITRYTFQNSVHLPPGRYRLVEGNGLVSVEQFEIKAGEETVLDFGG